MNETLVRALSAKEKLTGAERRQLRRELNGSISRQEKEQVRREGAMRRFFNFLQRVSTVALPTAEMRQEQKAAARARMEPSRKDRAEAKRERRKAVRSLSVRRDEE